MSKTPTRIEPTERELHASVADMLSWALLPNNTVWTTFPAGGYLLNRAAAGHLRRKGLKAGMPDILIWWYDYYVANIGYGKCIGIELKVGKNKLSATQSDVWHQLKQVGVNVYVCRSLEDVVKALKEEDVPMRPNVGLDHESNHPEYRHTRDSVLG